MGLTGVTPSDLPWLDTGGLQNFLQQIVDQLQRQHDALEDFQDQLGALAISIGIDGAVRGSLRSPGSNGADAASGSHGEGLTTTRGCLTASMQTLANRLAKVEATQAEHQANISSQLHSFVQKSEARHAADRDWISQELRGHQEECLGKLNQSSQALEARVRVAESKASECRSEARAHRDSSDDQSTSIARLESQVEKLSRAVSSAVATRETDAFDFISAGRASELIDDKLKELRDKVETKAAEAVMESMRKDLEQTDQVLRAAVEATGGRLADHEERLRSFDRLLRTHRAGSTPVSHGVEVQGQVDTMDVGHSAPEGSSHCLLCRSARSPSPHHHLVGNDGNVYPNADPHSLDFAQTAHLGGHLGAAAVRPQPTAPSIPTQGPVEGASLTSWNMTLSLPNTSAATTSMCTRSGNPRKQKDPLKRRETADCSMSGSTLHWSTSRISSRPSSATTSGDRGKRNPGSRMASTLGESTLRQALSMPTLDRSDSTNIADGR